MVNVVCGRWVGVGNRRRWNQYMDRGGEGEIKAAPRFLVWGKWGLS